MEWNVKKGDFSQMGVTKGKGWINFCFEGRKESVCKIVLYNRENQTKAVEIPVSAEYSRGNFRAIRVYELDMGVYDYNFEIDGKIVQDFYAKRIVGRDIWADKARELPLENHLTCRYEESNFSWRGEEDIEIARKDMVLYKLHVRGFTKGLPESTPDRGTFKALMKKIPYLKALGITSVELMPVYEFEELNAKVVQEVPEYTKWKSKKKDKIKKPERKTVYKTNYWGYGSGMYYAPKKSYAAGENAALELKECILQMHKKGMECILEMYFSKEVRQEQILDILHYWVNEYHVDGFHLQGENIPVEMLVNDPYLGRTKLFYKGFHEDIVAEEEKNYPRAFVDTDEFLYPARKLLNSINGNVWELADQMKKQNDRIGYVNYLADNNGFTLADLFTYEYKHNEANGENNCDGPEWNFSSNCGVEGETTSRNVQKARERRMKNAIAMLFLSQGVPMLMAGDEDCNSQQGNNNAYCQDNAIGWKDWKQTKVSKEFLKFVKKMAEFRKEHPVLRMEHPMQMADTKGCGCPDLSYHEENAWISSSHINRRALGVLYCGRYAGEEEDIYIGFNFSDFEKKLALPKAKNKKKWYVYMDTGSKNAFLAEPEEIEENGYVLEAHSVCIIIGK
ncbi:MAG: glycogen operon protein GlgX [Lachnospiraceae bacterium]|nr:glycogen operon protein GlgX [Lachnospiraceae bacterium]